jgi:hypothetical protein
VRYAARARCCGVITSLWSLARGCWRQSQKAQTEQMARTLRRPAREYLQNAATLDGDKVPEIGLVCLKAQPRHANPPLPNSSVPRSRFTRRVSYSDQCAATTRAFRVISSLTPTTPDDEDSLAILRCANQIAADITQRGSSEMALNNARTRFEPPMRLNGARPRLAREDHRRERRCQRMAAIN